MSIFTDRLRLVLNAKNIQQKELACLCKFSSARLNNYINGRTEPSFDAFVSICKALAVSSDYLLGLTDNMEPCQPPVSEETKISNILTVEVPRDPFSDLSEKQRVLVENMLATMRSQNEQEKAVDEEEKEA